MIGPTNTYILSWPYLWINICPQSPLVIQMQTPTPEYTTPDGVTTEHQTAFHRDLGSGISYGTFHINPLPPDYRFVWFRSYMGTIYIKGTIL